MMTVVGIVGALVLFVIPTIMAYRHSQRTKFSVDTCATTKLDDGTYLIDLHGEFGTGHKTASVTICVNPKSQEGVTHFARPEWSASEGRLRIRHAWAKRPKKVIVAITAGDDTKWFTFVRLDGDRWYGSVQNMNRRPY